MSQQPPRVLFLTSEAPHTGAAGAIVFHRLFSGYPPERLLVVTSHLPPENTTRLSCRYEHLPLKVDRLNRTRFWRWRNALRVLGGPRWLNLGAVDQALAGFEPDVVVTLMQDGWFYDYAARYARARKLPLVLFIHDLPDGFEPVASFLRARQARRDIEVYRQAACRLCISEPMRAHFLAAAGVKGDVLLPPRAETPVSQPPETCNVLRQPGRLTLGYAGGLHYGYGEQILRLLPALRDTGTVLEVFGPRPAGILASLNDATDVLHFHGYAPTPEEAWRGLLQRCDAVLQPYLNPPGEHHRQYRSHFPSKLGDCLALGLPVVVTGPPDAAGSAWCLAHPGCAMVVTDPDVEAFAAALLRLRDNSVLRVSLATGAQAASLAFAPEQLRRELSNALESAVRSARPR
jgi:glycosyltransferase involved in cell wall biosynthesis